MKTKTLIVRQSREVIPESRYCTRLRECRARAQKRLVEELKKEQNPKTRREVAKLFSVISAIHADFPVTVCVNSRGTVLLSQDGHGITVMPEAVAGLCWALCKALSLP